MTSQLITAKLNKVFISIKKAVSHQICFTAFLYDVIEMIETFRSVAAIDHVVILMH